MLRRLVESDLLQVRCGMHYLGEGGETYVSWRDGVHVSSVRARNRSWLRQDHRAGRPHWRHTRATNGTVVAMKLAGLAVYAGWRTIVNLEDLTQVPPDGVLVAGTNLREREIFLELERSARTPQHARRKLDPYVKVTKAEVPIWVAFICETQHGAEIFRAEVEAVYREEGVFLLAMVTTLNRVKEGPLMGEETIWEMHGQRLEMW